MHSILVVDDELSIRESFSLVLEGKYKVLQAASGEAALKIITDQKVDLAFLDIRMPGLNGLETLRKIKRIDPAIEIIMVTAVNDVRKASEAIKLGARDYIIKPFDVDHVLHLAEQILRKKNIVKQGKETQKSVQRNPAEIIGQTEKMQNIEKQIELLDSCSKNLLILGEFGTEKELVAHLIHSKSTHAMHSFQVVNLSQESVSKQKNLFLGYGKGKSAFDLNAEAGLLEKIGAGTLFINNVELLAPEVAQVLLSLEFSRIGSHEKMPIKTRLLGGTSQDILALNKITSDLFSKDYIKIPPLRERSSDLPLLVNHFLSQYNAELNKNLKIGRAAMEVLGNYSWPGNTLELEILVKRLVLTHASSEIAPEDLPLGILLEVGSGIGGKLFSRFEKEYVRQAFELCSKDTKKTASFLGVNQLVLEAKL